MSEQQNSPYEVTVEAGDSKFFCSCGLSNNKPYCDGSHKDTGKTPYLEKYNKDSTVYICGCQQSKNKPYCDGTPIKLSSKVETKQKEPTSKKYIEPHIAFIQELAKNGLSKVGHHGPMGAMGVPLSELPAWSDIQIITAQLANTPLLDDAPVETKTIIGPQAKKPLELDIPILISDMSFGALSREAKLA